MRFARAATILLFLAAAPYLFFPSASGATKKPTAKTSRKIAAKKTTKRRTVRRATTVVSPKVRAAATEQVSETLASSAGIPIENPAALVPFFEMLRRSAIGDAPGPISILHYGDSHTAADEWTGSVRALLQSQFGDGGGGYSFAGKPFRSYRRLDLKSGGSKGWVPEGLLTKGSDGLYGLGGVSISTDQAGQSVFVEADCKRLELFYLRQPGGGELQLYDNGEPVQIIATDGELGPGFFEYKLPENASGAHRFELETLSHAPVKLFGWVTEKDRGVTYETLGINGAQASIVFRWDEALLASHIARRNPALIVLAYGTNEAGSREWSEESYGQMFAALLHRMRQAAPAASILVLGPPDREYRVRGRWASVDKLDQIVAVQRQVAIASRCAFWDMREKMGGKGAMGQWVTAGLAQRDHVHFTAPGYHRLGETLFRDLMYNYEKYTKVRDELARADSDGPTNRPTRKDQ